MMEFGLLGMLLFWGILLVLIGAGAVWAVRQISSTRQSDESGHPTARQVLDEQFARGEIGVEEYEAVRAQIEA